MIEQLPEGKSIGWMQAPPQWIFSHTVRFVGIVRIVIQDGEGFILIRKGTPLAYYFRHGRIESKTMLPRITSIHIRQSSSISVNTLLKNLPGPLRSCISMNMGKTSFRKNPGPDPARQTR